jgi:hypothetical protein
VYRGFLFDRNRTGVLVFTTDLRTAKATEIRNNDAYEAVFYFPEKRRQFRFSGFCELLTDNQFPHLASKVPPAEPLSCGDGRTSPQSSPIYPVASPVFYDQSYEEIMGHAGIPPQPTEQEWRAEWNSKWEKLSPQMRASFRKPPPGSLLTEESQKQLDALSRGVDGAADNDGLENFACVLLFVNSVDVVDVNDVGRRQLISRVGLDEWAEQDVCP